MVASKRAKEPVFSDRLAELGVDHVHVGVPDLDGSLRLKRVEAAKAAKLASDGYQFCDVLYNWDTAEHSYGSGAYADLPAEIDPGSLRRWPFADHEAICIADFLPPFGLRSPRNQLISQLEKARAMGFSVHSAFEFEFNILAETPASLRAKGFRGLDHFAPANRTYSLPSLAQHGDLLAGLQAVMGVLGIKLDALHSELGPGCFEAPLTHAEGLRAADDAVLFKNAAKAYFLRAGLVACFMSKLRADLAGQSGHLHLSLRRLSDGAPAFADPAAPQRLSETARHFIGGLTRLMPELLALCSQTINAYKRIVPGMWAPTAATWGVQNRTVALRVINDAPAATRVEFRVPSADTNPYSALAMCLGAGLWGIEHRIEPEAPRSDDCYASPAPPAQAFPADLAEATARLQASVVGRQIFGDTFIDCFARSRLAEVQAHRRHVSAWEVARYLEVV